MAFIDRDDAGRSGAAALPLAAGTPLASSGTSGFGIVGLFAATLVLAAFLLFSLQPMFTKRVLPLLGGSPAVWSIAMVVFQALLLAGYAYAHAITRFLSPCKGVVLHALVLGAGFTVLPVAVAAGFEAPPAETEAFWLIGLFLASVGLPFFALSASAPLLQAWFARSSDARANDPYFLYRSSNAGSFVALLAYPAVVEPLLGLNDQARLWSLGYAILAIAVLACALAARTTSVSPLPVSRTTARLPIRAGDRFAWIGLSAIPSGLLVAATAHISTDVAAIPLIWVAPLALYLLSFIVAYRQVRAWPYRPLAAIQIAGSGFAFIWIVLGSPTFFVDLFATLALLFVNAIVAHRTVYERRPTSDRLTEFYLCTSFGGVIGGVFAALVAPRVFSGIDEYPILLAAALACQPGLLIGGKAAILSEGRRILFGMGLVTLAVAIAAAAQAVGLLAPEARNIWITPLIAGLLFAMGLSWRVPFRVASYGAVAALACILLPPLTGRDGQRVRSFFGLHKVMETPDGQFRILAHGTTFHGAMRIRNEDGTAVNGRPEPTTYYGNGSAMVEVLEIARQVHGPLPAVSIVGLGAGSLACQSQQGESWAFFEIDPAVIRIATDPARFRFLSDCAPQAAIVQGDARLTLGKRLDKARVLIVDAFSSDAIPMHLLTREALDVNLGHLDPKGVLALHISNRHFELRHVLARIAADRGLTLLHRSEQAGAEDAARWRFPSHVVMLTRDPEIEREAVSRGWLAVAPDLARRPWTDDYANALEAMADRWRAPSGSSASP